MASKQNLGGTAPDGSAYVTLTDGDGAISTGLPVGATPITATASGTTGATAATLSGAAGKTTYIAGFTIGSRATAAVAGLAAVSGTVSGTMNFSQGAAAAPAIATLTQTFNPPIPASATNTSIVVTSAAAGTAGVTDVSAWGYRI